MKGFQTGLTVNPLEAKVHTTPCIASRDMTKTEGSLLTMNPLCNRFAEIPHSDLHQNQGEV